MTSHGRGSIIDGVNDEVVYTFTGTLAGLASLVAVFLLWNRYRNSPQRTHPDSKQDVQNAHTRTDYQDLTHANRENSDPNCCRRDRDITCPICTYDAADALETNCGHVFCGNCFVAYWQHGSWMYGVICPYCRQQVTILYFLFTEEESVIKTPNCNKITRHINSYNRRFSGVPRQWIDSFYDLLILLHHCLSEYLSVGGLIWVFGFRVITCFVAALLYYISSPLEIIPEACFGLLGLLDDFFILLLLVIYISIMYQRITEVRAAAVDNSNDIN